MDDSIILNVNNLTCAFHTEDGVVKAVDDVSFELKRTKTLGVVGESGCGKSVTALSIMRLLPQPAGFIQSGQVLFDGKDMVSLPHEAMYRVRGRKISMIFQEPMTALNPVYKIGRQLSEIFAIHFGRIDGKERYERSLDLLEKVGIPDPDKRMNEYPHQISGGMRQRVMIAMAIACEPEILIADEPTTALDVTIQAQILDLIQKLQSETGMSVIFITHDLGVIAEISDDVLVMYAGKVAETGSVSDIFKYPAHPYTKGLLKSIPRLDSKSKTQLSVISGMVPSLKDLPEGCRFYNRCPDAQAKCKKMPPLEKIGENHMAACHFIVKFP